MCNDGSGPTLGIYNIQITKGKVSLSLLAPAPQGIVCSSEPERPRAKLWIYEGGNVRLEYNPSKWDAGQTAHLWAVLEYVLQMRPEGTPAHVGAYGPHTLAHVLAYARVTRVDVAVDVYGVAMEDLAFWDKKPDVVLYDHADGLGTKYQGGFKKNARLFCIYDKARERRAALKDDDAACAALPAKWLRLEARVTNPNIMGKDLAGLKNPFMPLFCIMPSVALEAAGYPPLCRRSLALLMTLAGVPRALATVESPVLLAKVKAALDGAIPAWWNPPRTWKGWPDAVAGVLPIPATVCN